MFVGNHYDPYWSYLVAPVPPFPQYLPPFTNIFEGNPPFPQMGAFPQPHGPATEALERRPQEDHETIQRDGEGSASLVEAPTSIKKKKAFKKDKVCPVSGCIKRYSSRIALRAHLRKFHPRWMDETSDFEP